MNALERIGELLLKGGFVMPPLVLGALLLWFALGYRFVTLYAGDRRSLDVLIGEALADALRPTGVVAESVVEGVRIATSRLGDLRGHLDEHLGPRVKELRRFETLASSVVRAAPLLGLLGTVAGMIDTFDALGSSTNIDQAGGVAGGISEALFSTQLGLVVAIPGLLIGRVLTRRAELLETRLDRLKDLLAIRFGTEEVES